MKPFWVTALSVVILCVATSPVALALTANQILVVYNDSALPSPDDPSYAAAAEVISASKGVAQYYATERGIPSNNLIGLSMVPVDEDSTDAQYVAVIARPLWNNYLSKPEYSNIKVIVMCYGVPSHINLNDSNPWRSVDSWLTLLGNDGALDAATMRIWRLNPYHQRNQNFQYFRRSALNRIGMGEGVPPWKLNYLVCRLDGYSTPTTEVTIDNVQYNIPSDVKALIDRATRANAAGRSGLSNAKVVLDDAPGTRQYPASTENNLNALLEPITGVSNNVWRDPSANTYLMNKQNLIAYSSNGSYDDSALPVTT